MYASEINGRCREMLYFVDCPLWYFGYNCSQKCPPPHYGKFCTQICKHGCQDCHHRDGCTPQNKAMGILKKDNWY